MSNPFDEPLDSPEDGDDEATEFEPDVATVAFLDQQQAEFGNMEEEFEATYGFKHECHCGEDYAAGRVGEITQCYHNMMQEALATCARLNADLKEITGIAQALYGELRERIEREDAAAPAAGDPENQDDPEPGPGGGVQVDTEPEPEPGGSDDDRAIADAAGEGLGTARIEPGNTNDEGTPGDRKLV